MVFCVPSLEALIFFMGLLSFFSSDLSTEAFSEITASVKEILCHFVTNVKFQVQVHGQFSDSLKLLPFTSLRFLFSSDLKVVKELKNFEL